MEYRTLGNSQARLSVVGLGTAAFGGTAWLNSWGPQDDAMSVRTIHHAIDVGINWIDTAPIYGQGHAEEVMGRALREISTRERPLVFTKCGLRWVDGAVGPSTKTLSPESIHLELERSMRRLGVDVVDLYQVHYPPETDGALLEDCWAELCSLRDKGTIRMVGVCNFAIADMSRCLIPQPPQSSQLSYSAIKPGAGDDVIPWCLERGIGVLVYRALASGLLTDLFSKETAARLEPTDWRTRDADFRSPSLDRHLAVRDALARVGKRFNASAAEMAVAWALACPGVTGVIVGAREPSQIDGWVASADVHLDAREWAEVPRQQPT